MQNETKKAMQKIWHKNHALIRIEVQKSCCRRKITVNSFKFSKIIV